MARSGLHSCWVRNPRCVFCLQWRIDQDEGIPKRRQRILCEGRELDGRDSLLGRHGATLPSTEPLDLVMAPLLSRVSVSADSAGKPGSLLHVRRCVTSECMLLRQAFD